MRKHAKYFYVLFFVVILSFIFWGVGGIDKSTATPIVRIDGEKITVEDYWTAYERAVDVYREIYKDKFPEMEEKLNLKRNVLDAMIEERVLAMTAKSIGIKISDEELGESITGDPAFQRDGKFRKDIYENILRRNRLTPKTYEVIKERELLSEKMRALIQDSVVVNPDELKGLPQDENFIKSISETILRGKREQAMKSYIAGLKKRMKIVENTKGIL
jgi:peptidyl-prolyl cis-trans isomerase D